MNLTSNRRADEFNRLLESDVRTDDPVTGPLLAVADALESLPRVDGPRPEFRTALRQRLVAVATVQGVGSTETPLQRARAASGSWRVQRRLTALAAGAAVVTGITGVGLGASRSLPGDPFYGVKRAAEDVQLATTVGTEARGKRHLEFARTRLAEVESLAGSAASLAPGGGARTLAAPASVSGRTKLIIDTLHDMDVETRTGANDLFQAFRDSGSSEPLRALDRFSRDQYSRLSALLPELPAAAQASARGSLALLAVVAANTTSAATGSQPAGSSGTPAPGSTAAVTPTPTATAPTGSGGTSTGPTPTSTSTKSSGTPLQVPTQLTSPLPSPSLPTIPPLTTITTPLPSELPSELPTVPDLGGLLGQ